MSVGGNRHVLTARMAFRSRKEETAWGQRLWRTAWLVSLKNSLTSPITHTNTKVPGTRLSCRRQHNLTAQGCLCIHLATYTCIDGPSALRMLCILALNSFRCHQCSVLFISFSGGLRSLGQCLCLPITVSSWVLHWHVSPTHLPTPAAETAYSKKTVHQMEVKAACINISLPPPPRFDYPATFINELSLP